MKKNLTKSMKEIETDFGSILVSYWTPVAFVNKSGDAYKTAQRWSATTSRHISRWLGGLEADVKPQAFFNALYKEAV